MRLGPIAANRRRSGGSSVPTSTIAPALSGHATVGQYLFTSDGSWDVSPTSCDYQWYKASGGGGPVAIPFETSNSYLVDDADVGSAITCQVVAYNGALASSPASTSPSTAVINIDLTTDAPTLTRVSGSGVTPVSWTIGYKPKTYAGYAIEIMSASDSAFTTILQDVERPILESEMDGTTNGDWSATTLTAFGATDYVRGRVKAVSPEGVHYASPWSSIMQITDSVTPVIWNDSDKSSSSMVVTAGLQATQQSGFQGIRATRGSATQKWYAEHHVTNMSGSLAIGAASAGTSFSDWAGNISSDAACLRSDGEIYWGGGDGGNSGHTFGGGDWIQTAVDPVAKKLYIGINNSWLVGDPVAGTGGLSLAGASGALIPIFQAGFGAFGEVTSKFTSFNYTPPTGFTAIP